MANRLRRVLKRIGSVNDRSDFARLDQVFYKRQVICIGGCRQTCHRLTAAPGDKRTHHQRLENLPAFSANHNIRPLRFERAAIVRERAIAVHCQNQIVTLTTAGEIFAGVVNDMVCAQSTEAFHFFRAGYCCDFHTEGFGNLHHKRPHASRRADNCYMVPGLDAPFAQPLKCRDRRHRHCCRLLKGQVGRLLHQNRFTCADIFSKTAKACGNITEDLVARLKAGDVFPHSLDAPGNIRAHDLVFRSQETKPHQSRNRSTQQAVISGIDRGGKDPDQHLVIFGGWCGNIRQC